MFVRKISDHVTDKAGEVDDGFVEEATEAIVGGGKAISEHLANSEVAGKAGEVVGACHDALREGAKKGLEAIHGTARAMNAAEGVDSQGVPDVKDGTEALEEHIDTIQTAAEEIGTSTAEGFDSVRKAAPGALNVVDRSGALEENIEAAAEHVGETVVKNLGRLAADEVMGETAEAVAEMAPVLGAAVPSYHVATGAVTAGVGVGGLVVGGGAALFAVLVGLVSAKFDRGAAWGRAMEVCRKVSAWSACVAIEGLLIFAKGAAGFMNQVCPLSKACLPPASCLPLFV